MRVAAYSSDGPGCLPQKDPAPIHNALADAVLCFIPEGARLHYGPGQLGGALMRRASVPLQIDTGMREAFRILESESLIKIERVVRAEQAARHSSKTHRMVLEPIKAREADKVGELWSRHLQEAEEYVLSGSEMSTAVDLLE